MAGNGKSDNKRSYIFYVGNIIEQELRGGGKQAAQANGKRNSSDRSTRAGEDDETEEAEAPLYNLHKINCAVFWLIFAKMAEFLNSVPF